jgi:hypothetical protein
MLAAATVNRTVVVALRFLPPRFRSESWLTGVVVPEHELSAASHRLLGNGGDRSPCPLMLPVLLFVSSRFRPPKYLGIPPRPRESPGSTRTGRLLGLSHPPDRGWVVPRVSSERGWGLSAPGSRRGCGSTAAHDFWEHDNRHTLVTELSESGAGDEVIMSIAGHVSRAMLSRYSHVRMEAKRRALDEIGARQRAADEKRPAQAGRG